MRPLTPQEISELASAGVTEQELASAWDVEPNQDFITAVGEVLKFKAGQGQLRSEDFAEPQANAEVATQVEAEHLGNTETQANLEVADQAVSEGLTGGVQTTE